MYIAGQSYIEMSKDTEISKEDKEYSYAEKQDNNDIEVKKDTEKDVEVKTFTYLSKGVQKNKDIKVSAYFTYTNGFD